MSEDLNQNKPEDQESGFKALWNKPLKMSDKEIAKLKKKGKTITLKAKSGSSAQEAADDYWFIEEPTNESPLSEIVEPEAAIDLSTDFMAETLERKTDALLGASRHRLKK